MIVNNIERNKVINQGAARSLIHRVYKLGRYQTVGGDLLPSTLPVASGSNTSKAATDRSMESGLGQPSH